MHPSLNDAINSAFVAGDDALTFNQPQDGEHF